MIRVFQNGRVSTRSYARLTALITAPIAPLAAQVAPAAPTTNATTDVPFDVSCCSVSIVVEHVVRARPGRENSCSVVVGPDQVEQADEEDHRGEEREQRAEGNLRGQAHAVVGEERC